MRKLDAGISLEFPSAEAERGYEYRWCCGWQLLFRTHPKLGREGAIYACDAHGTEHH